MFQLEESVHNESGFNGDFPEVEDTDEENNESSQLVTRNHLDKVSA